MVQPGRPIANPAVVLREDSDDWAVLFNTKTADAAALNPVGVMVWKLMDGEHTIDEIVAAICLSFAGVPAVVEKHVLAFINELAERDFATYAPAKTVPNRADAIAA